MTRTVPGYLAAFVLALFPALAGAGERATAEPMRPCPRYGAGFVASPGGGTCLRVSGRVAADLVSRSRHERPAPVLAPTGRLSIDTRTETEYGPVRTFVRIGGR